MRVRLTQPKRSVQEVLTRLRARLTGPEVRALFLGAQASTSFRIGPQHLLEHIFGPDLELGDTREDANENLQTLMWLWNALVQDHEKGQVRLAPFDHPSPPTADSLAALLMLRDAELTWFVRGIDAGGDDPMEFGEEGQRLLRGIAEGGAFLKSFQELLGRAPAPTADQVRSTVQSVTDMTSTLESLIEGLLSVSDDIRKHALAEMQRRDGHGTDDGLAPARVVRVGRNDPCPCGSGKKWKRCCGGVAPAQH